jgi:acetylornithine aminotransferase
MKKKVNVNFDEILDSLEMGSDEITQYLNTETGGIAMVSEMGDAFDEDGTAISRDGRDKFCDEKYIALPIVNSREGYEDMVEFIPTVADARIRTKLENSLDQRRPFRRFKDVLMSYPSEEKRWFKFKENINRKRAYQWIEEHNLEVNEPSEKQEKEEVEEEEKFVLMDPDLPHILCTYPVVKNDIIRAEGSFVYDSAGIGYVDFESGMWCTVLGHNHKSVQNAIGYQLQSVMHLHPKLTSTVSNKAARVLLDLVHWKNGGKAVFLSSGSEAVELCVKMAKIVTGRSAALTFSNSYLSALGESGNFLTRDSWTKIDFLKCLKCSEPGDRCPSGCPQLAGINYADYAAFVFEPGTSSGRVIFPPLKLVQSIVEGIRAARGLIVVDEVTTGLGRTGKWFGYNHYDIQPDLAAVGKSLGNGYPVSAALVEAKVAEELERKNFYYAQSHQNDPLGCSVAKTVIKVLKKEKLIKRSNDLGKEFLQLLLELKEQFDFIAEVRGRGLMLAMELEEEAWKQGMIDTIFEQMLCMGYFIGAVRQRDFSGCYIKITYLSRMSTLF